jgi:hypothetical protein
MPRSADFSADNKEEVMLPVETSELIDTELDVVCGGFLNNFLNFGLVEQTNTAVPVAVKTGGGGPTNILQEIGQENFSFI